MSYYFLFTSSFHYLALVVTWKEEDAKRLILLLKQCLKIRIRGNGKLKDKGNGSLDSEIFFWDLLMLHLNYVLNTWRLRPPLVRHVRPLSKLCKTVSRISLSKSKQKLTNQSMHIIYNFNQNWQELTNICGPRQSSKCEPQPQIHYYIYISKISKKITGK